jgi:hypothetical protein
MPVRIRKGFPEFLEVIEYTETFANGHTLDKVAMYNTTVVSTVEVNSWINQGLIDIETKPTVVVMTKQQYQNLFDHVSYDDLEKASDTFYEDLRIEQSGGIN